MITENEKMLEAVLHNDLEKAKIALDLGADVHYMNDTAIDYATNYDNVEMMGLLIKHGALTEYSRRVALARSAIQGSLKMMDLLTSKADFSQKDLNFALENACLYKKTESAQYLINKGAEVNDDCIIKAVASQSLEIIAFLVIQNNDYIEKVLASAKENDDITIVNWCEGYKQKKELKENLEKTLIQNDNKVKKVKL